MGAEPERGARTPLLGQTGVEAKAQPTPAPEIIMDANGIYWRRYEEDCPSCYGGRPKWAGTMPAPPCGKCHGVGRRVHLSMVPTSSDNDPVPEPYVVYKPEVSR
jgi:hypothetical protein